eukprot:2046063-Lingulodinium_polyedra.AAC.1
MEVCHSRMAPGSVAVRSRRAIHAHTSCWRLRSTRDRNSAPLPSSPSTRIVGASTALRGTAPTLTSKAMHLPP